MNDTELYENSAGIKNDIIVIIPARGGSVRVPGKNVRELNGKPLISWTIEQAILADITPYIFVSTDDQRIADTARMAGARVVDRPSALAGPESKSEEALIHVINTLQKKGCRPNVVIMLQCTSPLRRPSDIRCALETFKKTNAGAVMSVVDHRAFLWQGSPENPIPLTYDPSHRPRSQEMQPLYKENGSIYIIRPNVLIKTGNRLNPPVKLYVMPPYCGLDIDSDIDFEICGFLMKHYMKELN